MKALLPLPAHRMRTLVLSTLVGVNLLLTIGLLAVSLRGRPTLLVPGLREETVVRPGEVPTEALQRFTLYYLLHFDDYTPATVVARGNYLLRFVSPDRVETARRALEERATYAVRAREAVQLSLPLPDEVSVIERSKGVYHASITALRRTFIADAPKGVDQVRYRLEIAPAVSSVTNPFGLEVRAQTVETVSTSPEPSSREESHAR